MDFFLLGARGLGGYCRRDDRIEFVGLGSKLREPVTRGAVMRILTNTNCWNTVCRHLLPKAVRTEHAAFLLGAYEAEMRTIRVLSHELLLSEDFVAQEIDYLELKDSVRARLIKRAHDNQACLIEMHSHPGDAAAAFSLSDFSGLQETVPHMLWRLKGQPYAAIVVANSSFDALAWYPDASRPVKLDGVAAGEQLLTPTNISIHWW